MTTKSVSVLRMPHSPPAAPGCRSPRQQECPVEPPRTFIHTKGATHDLANQTPAMRHRPVWCSIPERRRGPGQRRAAVERIAVRTLTSQNPALNPFAQARFAAIVQLAVFEAVNSITGDYQGYLGSPSAPTGASVSAPIGSSPEAAAIAAAYRVLITFFGADAATALALNNDRAASLALIPDGTPKTTGIATGEAAAVAVMAVRAGDGSSPLTNYLPTPAGAGDWNLTPGCPTTPGNVPLGGILFNWGDIKPFGIELPASGHWYEPFRPVPPPHLRSTE